MKYLKYFESTTYTKFYKFEETSRGHHHGQTDMTMYMYFRLGRDRIAKVDYSIYQGKIHIEFANAYITGKRYTQEIIKELAKIYKYENIEWGGLTPGGVVLKREMDIFHDFDPEKYLDSKNKHLSKNVLDKIECPYIKAFLKNMVELGYKEAWDIVMKTDNYKKLITEYDLNDISHISEWIKGSMTNDHFPEYDVPKYVIEELNKLY